LKLFTELELSTCVGKTIPNIYDPLSKTYLRISYLEKLLTNFQVFPL